jgi:hypothetical protein
MRRPTKTSWTEDDLARLRAHVASGGSAARAAIILKRSIVAVKRAARREGCPFPHDFSIRRKLRASAEQSNIDLNDRS